MEYRKRQQFLSPLEQQKVSFLRLFLVFALVLLHFGGLYGTGIDPREGYFGQDYPLASIVVSYALFIGFTAVPALSVISGYLFFIGADSSTPPDFATRMRKRFGSLVLPFLIWGGLFTTLAFLASRLTGSLYQESFPAGPGLIWAFVNGWLGLTDYPVAIQLWFVRDLILTVLVSPLIWVAVSRAPAVTLAALFVLWLADHDLWIFTRLDVVGFFALGAAFAIHGWRRDLPERLALPVLALFLSLVLLRTLVPALLGESESWGLYVATCLLRIVGVVAVWNAAPLFMKGPVPGMTANFSYLAFFMHCAHFPPIQLVKAVVGRLLNPQDSFGQLAVYGLTVSATLVMVFVAAQILRLIAPALFSILSGGRSGPETRVVAAVA